jgi:hypothetical protein
VSYSTPNEHSRSQLKAGAQANGFGFPKIQAGPKAVSSQKLGPAWPGFFIVKDSVIAINSGEFSKGDVLPKDDVAVEPSKDVKSETDVDEVEKLDANDIWVIVDRDGSSECTWFSRAGEVGVVAVNVPRWKARIGKVPTWSTMRKIPYLYRSRP